MKSNKISMVVILTLVIFSISYSYLIEKIQENLQDVPYLIDESNIEPIQFEEFPDELKYAEPAKIQFSDELQYGEPAKIQSSDELQYGEPTEIQFSDELQYGESARSNNRKAAYYRYNVGPWGGTGGNYFSYLPPSNSKIYAIAIRCGTVIDKIIVYYKLSDGRIVKGLDQGGNGGTYKLHFFEGNEYIKRIAGRGERYLNQLRIWTNKKYFKHGGNGGKYFNLGLPPKHQVLGFFGRSGAYIDNIGFYMYTK